MKYIKLFENFNSDFDTWFKDSKVVDSNGKPLLVFHGSTEEISNFHDGDLYFTNDYYTADGYAHGEYVYDVYLSIQNPLIIDAKGKKWDYIETPYGTSTQEVLSNLDRTKYDGIIFNNIKDDSNDDEDYQEAGTVYVVLKASQIRQN
jgi:hypothetical protein